MKFTAVILFFTLSLSVKAQTLKFGHIDIQSLIQIMPERAIAETDFNTFQDKLEEVLGDMQKDLQLKMSEFEKLDETASEIRKNAKITEIQDIQKRIQNYQQNANQQLQQKQADLFKPILEKAQKAIEDVAKESSLIYVFDTSAGNTVVLYKSTQSVDVLPLVKQKLAIK